MTSVRLLPSSLRGRVALAFIGLSLATWLVVGVALFVVLRGLHSEATTARLADVSVPLVSRARADLVAGMRVPAVLADLRDQVAGTDVSIYLQLADGRIVTVGGAPSVLDGLTVDPSVPAGGIDHGTYPGSDGATWAWVAAVMRDTARGSRALVAATPDRSGAEALRDLFGALPAVVLVSLLVGIPIAWWLARSVTEPLRRLVVATREVPTASGPFEPLPLDGPSEVRELTVRFDGMRADLRGVRRRERELLANLRHDLRTPLTVIAGFAEALRDGTASGPEAGRAAAAIEQEARRIDALVDDLGTIEGLEGGTTLRPEPLDAAALVAEAASRFGQAAAAAGIDIAVTGPGGTIPFVGDRRAVERILSNLVDNAVAAVTDRAGTTDAAGGRIRGHVWLDARPLAAEGTRPEAVLLSVTDDGPGFAPGTTDRAFDRLYRADPSRTGGGSGLGLAIVRELAIAHGGMAHAENVAPHGARLSVVLPRVPVVPGRSPRGPGDAALRPSG